MSSAMQLTHCLNPFHKQIKIFQMSMSKFSLLPTKKAVTS